LRPITIGCVLLLAVTLAVAPAAGENWPGFRGPDGSGISSDFNASPAISGGQIFIRSNRFIYCIQNKGASIALADININININIKKL